MAESPTDCERRAPHEIFARLDVQGSQLLAVLPKPNENVRKNAWLLGRSAPRAATCGMVGARGLRVASEMTSELNPT